MKHTLRYCFILLALATTGLFAEAATEPTVVPSAQHKTVKVAKNGKKHGKHARKHHRKHHKKKAV